MKPLAALGIAMLVLPGPGILTIILGLMLLGVEFAFARRWLCEPSQRALFDLSWPQHFWIERTTIPVHVIGAADDLFFPPSLVEATAGLHGVAAEIVPDIAHALMLDANWEQTARGLAAWLERVLR